MHWGEGDAALSAPFLWSAGMGLFVVLAGWRAPRRGALRSAWRGTLLAVAINVPAYFAGRWLVFGSHDCSLLDSLLGPAIKHTACGG